MNVPGYQKIFSKCAENPSAIAIPIGKNRHFIYVDPVPCGDKCSKFLCQIFAGGNQKLNENPIIL